MVPIYLNNLFFSLMHLRNKKAVNAKVVLLPKHIILKAAMNAQVVLFMTSSLYGRQL